MAVERTEMDDYRDFIERVVTRLEPSFQSGKNTAAPRQGKCVSVVSPAAQKLWAQAEQGLLDNVTHLSDERKRGIASLIDHTVLNPAATADDIARLCAEADRFGFASAVAQPCWMKFIRNALTNPHVRVCGIAGFPLGGSAAAVKAAEAAGCVDDGAGEVDMVINIGRAKMGDWNFVQKEISQVVEAAGESAVKVIIECCLLTDEEKVKACLCAVNGGAHWVKSSTGFSKHGARVADIALMRRVVGPDFGVKASGGIRNLPALIEMIKAGADRIGASSGAEIMGD